MRAASVVGALGLERSPGRARALHTGTPKCLQSTGRHAALVANGNRTVPGDAVNNRSAEIAPSSWARRVSVLCNPAHAWSAALQRP